eukprot:2894591-Rhodomonas_salina.2
MAGRVVAATVGSGTATRKPSRLAICGCFGNRASDTRKTGFRRADPGRFLGGTGCFGWCGGLPVVRTMPNFGCDAGFFTKPGLFSALVMTMAQHLSNDRYVIWSCTPYHIWCGDLCVERNKLSSATACAVQTLRAVPSTVAWVRLRDQGHENTGTAVVTLLVGRCCSDSDLSSQIRGLTSMVDESSLRHQAGHFFGLVHSMVEVQSIQL